MNLKFKTLFQFSLFNIEDVAQIDRISRRLFPATFLIFNLFYWTYYKFWAKEDEQNYRYATGIRELDLGETI